MTSNKKYQDEDWLRRKYIDEELLQREIGDICGVKQGTISIWLDKFDISKEEPKYKNPEWIQNKLEDGYKPQEIVDECDIGYNGIRYHIRNENLGTYKCHVDDCEERFPTEGGLKQHLSGDHPSVDYNGYGLDIDHVKQSLEEVRREKINNGEDQYSSDFMKQNLQKARKIYDSEKHSEFMKEYWEGLDEKDYPVNQDSFWPKYLESRDNWGPNWRTIEETGHKVASDWEAEVDIMLHNSSLQYEYEGKTFTIEDTWNTPDFMGNGWILEVKSPAGYRDKERLDMVGEYLRDEVDEEYIILGEDVDMPCNQFVEWSDRNNIISVLREYSDANTSPRSVFDY